MTTARDIMTADVQCVRSTDPVIAAAELMTDLNIGALPICGADDSLEGMLTDRDIVVRVVAERKDPLVLPVGELAEGTPVTVDADDDVRKVVSVMSQHQIRRLPVLEAGKLVGIIAQADIAVELGHAETGNTVEAVSIDY
ncbi:CBS domain-containing protein [Nocardia bovistercoris]|uniref:CBS domain-containing protein n=1 Tax=Nocardia bovistercoris TaxID=2785916 RepID=A0A931N452_9NOCA|nr:CBS domain-containing protein [Nocardia bovistercoris]MBH0777891.1 CBS domain-containing protein [Nocardia bovistercoris]